MPTYEKLVDAAPLLFTLLLVQAGFAVALVIKNFLNKEKRKLAINFSLGFSPLVLTAAIDLIRRYRDNTQTYTYLSLFGWLFSIIVFIIVLSIRFARIYARNIQLTNHLQDEVDKRTIYRVQTMSFHF